MAGAGRSALLGAITGIILLATLLPAPIKPAGADISAFSARGVADALANVALFAPFGFAAALRFRSGVLAVAAGCVLSLLIELGQLAVPGRYATPADVVFNTAGTAVGSLLLLSFDVWARPRSWLRWLLPVVAVTTSMVVIGGSIFLFELAIPPHALFGQWTAHFEDMAQYEGRVLGAFVGMMPVPSSRIALSNTLRHRLLGGETVRVEFVAGPPPPSLAPIFGVFDDSADEMLLIGADSTDAVVRFRMRARALRLDERELRVPGAFQEIPAGKPASLRFYPEGRGYCVEVGSKQNCEVGFTLGDSWGLLLYPIPAWLALIMPYIWLAALALPAGFWIRHDAALAAVGLLLTITAVAAPYRADILPTPLPQFAAMLAGAALASFIGRRIATTSWPRAAPDPGGR